MRTRTLLLLLLGLLCTSPAGRAAEDKAAEDKAAKEGANDNNGWRALFAKEQFYKSRKEKEQVFRGKLERVPNAGGPSTLQRTSWYKLGKRTIYTGAKKVPVLEKLVGKQVEMRGKAVSFSLEGTTVNEIWPAAVRPAGK